MALLQGLDGFLLGSIYLVWTVWSGAPYSKAMDCLAELGETTSLGVRALRNLCKRLGVPCRGNRQQILDRLAVQVEKGVHLLPAKEDSEKKKKKKIPHDDVIDKGLVVTGKRSRIEPERYSPDTSVVDDSDDDWAGISLDSSGQDDQPTKDDGAVIEIDD